MSAQNFFKDAGSHPLSAASILACLSSVEYTGAKWILAVPAEQWDAGLHEHLNDELRHGKVMHDEALKARRVLGANELVRESENTERALEATAEYLQRLLARSFKQVLRTGGKENKFIRCYAYVSLLVERRLMKIYPEMARTGASESMRRAAAQLVEDERGHLTAVTSHIRESEKTIAADRAAFIAIEEEAAAVWIAALEKIFSTTQALAA